MQRVAASSFQVVLSPTGTVHILVLITAIGGRGRIKLSIGVNQKSPQGPARFAEPLGIA